MSPRHPPQYRFNILLVMMLMIFFTGVLLSLHWLGFQAIHVQLASATQNEAVAKALVLQNQFEQIQKSDSTATATGISHPLLPSTTEVLEYEKIAVFGLGQLSREEGFTKAQIKTLLQSGHFYREDRSKGHLVIYIPLEKNKFLAVSFSDTQLRANEKMIRRLAWFEGGAMAVLMFLTLAVFLWYSSPFSRMMKIAQTATDDSPSSGGGNDPEFLISTFQTALIEMRKRAETVERVSEDLMRILPAGVVTLNPSGIVVKANQSAREILTFHGTPEGRTYQDFFGTAPALRNVLERTLHRMEAAPRLEFTLTNQPHRTLEALITPMKASDGSVLGVLCLCTDISPLKDLESRLRIKDNFASLGEMTAGIAHEFRNSLAVILGFARLIETKTDTPILREYARDILKETQSAQNVINEFLDFSQPLEADKETVPLHSVLKELCEEARKRYPELELELECPDIHLFGDPVQLKQAFSNLVRNASEALSSASAAKTGSSHPPQLKINVTRSKTTAQITFDDNGPGIPASERKSVFVPFYTTKTQGTGLGLPLVQKIISNHDGEVELDDSPAGGARILIRLPLPGPEALDEPAD